MLPSAKKFIADCREQGYNVQKLDNTDNGDIRIYADDPISVAKIVGFMNSRYIDIRYDMYYRSYGGYEFHIDTLFQLIDDCTTAQVSK
jgi:hypothetical protein